MNRTHHTSRWDKGSITLELLIAFAVLALATSGVIIVIFGNQSVSVDTQTNNEALYKAQTILEQARAASRADFSSVKSWLTPQTEQSGPLTYTKKLDVADIDSFTKQATSTVSWTIGARSFSIVLSTLLTNPTAALGGDTCNPGLNPGDDWTIPQAYFLDRLGNYVSGNNSNGLGISDLRAYRNKLYVAANSATNNDYTFYVFSLPSNPNQPPLYEGGFDNDPNIPGPRAVAIATLNGKIYAFLASQSSFSRGQLQIVDVTNPIPTGWAPTIVNYKIPTSFVPNAGLGNSIFYSNGYVYLGLTAASGGTEFNIIAIDVNNPLNPLNPPTRVGGYSTEGHGINAIYVQGTYAYLAHPTASGDLHREQVTVVDVSTPANPQRVSGFYDVEGSGGNGKSLYLAGNRLYLGRTSSKLSGANDSIPEFYILNNSDPTSIPSTPLGSLPLPQTADSINGLAVRDHLAFFLTNFQFQIWDITNPSSINPWATPLSFQDNALIGSNFSGSTALNCTRNYFYAGLKANGSNKDYLAIIGPHVPSAYTLSQSGDITVVQGASGSNTIIRTTTSGFPRGETLTVSVPAGATVTSFTNNPCVPDCSGTLTIAVNSLMTPGTYPVTVSAPSGPSTTFNVVVNPGPFSYTVSNDAPGNFGVHRGNQGSVNIQRLLTSGVAQPVTLSITSVPVLPPDVTVSISNQTANPANPCTGACVGTVTISPAPTATANVTYTITVTGSPAGTPPATPTQFDVKVQP